MSALKVARTLTPVATLAPWSNAMRAHTWFVAKQVATPHRMTTPSRGGSFAAMRSAAIVLCALAAAPAPACDYPDEGNMPLRRAVSRVQQHTQKYGQDVKYEVLLDESVRVNGACYWTVEMRQAGKPPQRFYVTPDGKKLVPAPKPVPARH
jgi:hypothetical protein